MSWKEVSVAFRTLGTNSGQMKLQDLALLLLIGLTQSCAVLNTHTSKTLDIYGPGVIQLPTVADLIVLENKVTGIATEHADQPFETVKNLAIVEALKTSNADVLVEPVVESETKNGMIKVTVTGFPATYKNFRSMKAEDVPLVNAGVLHTPQVVAPTSVQRKKSGAGTVVGVLLGIGLLTYLLVAGRAK